MSFAVESKFKTQEEKLDVLERNQNWFIGMPLAPRDETRIPLVPSAVRVLTARGYKVMIESKAGKKAGFSDQEYSENGATVAYSKANCITRISFSSAFHQRWKICVT